MKNLLYSYQKDLGKKIQTGEFGADMKVQLINDGPVTIWIDTKEKGITRIFDHALHGLARIFSYVYLVRFAK